MNIMNLIKQVIVSKGKENVAKVIGYTKALQTLDKFLQRDSIFEWIHNGEYDLTYSSKEFFIKLCKVLDISDEIVQAELKQIEKKDDELRKYQNVYIFVNTNFKRVSQPIFALAVMEGRRRIIPKKEDLIFKTDKEVLEVISNIVKNHFKKTQGKLPLWGNIVNYVYHHSDGKVYIFSPDGTLNKGGEYVEGIATLHI